LLKSDIIIIIIIIIILAVGVGGWQIILFSSELVTAEQLPMVVSIKKLSLLLSFRDVDVVDSIVSKAKKVIKSYGLIDFMNLSFMNFP
jgi:hypothetical protein